MATQIDRFFKLKYLPDGSNGVTQSSKIKIPLKPHQLSLVNACKLFEQKQYRKVTTEYTDREIELNSSVGIIGDNVGSGKTYMALSLIAEGIIQNQSDVETEHHYYGKVQTIVRRKPIQVNNLNIDIVVVPHNILTQWDDALKNTTLKYMIYHKKGPITSLLEKCFSDTIKEDEEFNTKYWKMFKYNQNLFDHEKLENTFNNYDLILVSSTKYVEFCDIIGNYKVNRIIFDEADTINIASCPFLKNNFTWFITSTYENLIYPRGRTLYVRSNGELSDVWQGSYVDYYEQSNARQVERSRIMGISKTGYIRDTCYNIVRLGSTDLICSLVLKNHPDFVKSSFQLNEPRRFWIECDYDRRLFIVKDFVSGDVLSRLSAGDIAGAIERIDCEKVSSNENLVDVVTRDISKNLHNAELELQMKYQIVFSSKKAKEESIARAEEKVVELRSKIDNIRDKVLKEDLCPVCYDEVQNVTLTPCCNTKYCLECITMCCQKGNKKCPFCRAPLNMKDLIILTDEANTGGGPAPKEKLKDKIFAVKRIISDAKAREDPNFKLLIFADYDASFDNLINTLNEEGLKYFTIKGTSNTISKNIANYKSTDPHNPDKLDVLLLNSNYCGSGINLENTTDLIIYHDMTDSKITQIIGRAQRPGRTSILNIWRLLHDYEIPQSNISNRGNIGERINVV